MTQGNEGMFSWLVREVVQAPGHLANFRRDPSCETRASRLAQVEPVIMVFIPKVFSHQHGTRTTRLDPGYSQVAARSISRLEFRGKLSETKRRTGPRQHAQGPFA